MRRSVRLAQARGGELGHLEFLEVLLEDEISRREAKALAERLRRARFESEATLEEFDFAYNPGLPAPLIRDLAALRFLERGESVLLYGPVGVGKTHVASALGHLACRRGYSVLFAKTSRLLAELAGGRAEGSWESRLRRLARFDLLILDDFALRPFTGAQGDDFYELVSERSRHVERAGFYGGSSRLVDLGDHAHGPLAHLLRELGPSGHSLLLNLGASTLAGALQSYCRDGIARFVRGDYAWTMSCGMMLGYARDSIAIEPALVNYLAQEQSQLDYRVVSLPSLHPGPLPSTVQLAYCSSQRRDWQHRNGRQPGEIELTHLWLTAS
jgi:IstB-like ATP binding protein